MLLRTSVLVTPCGSLAALAYLLPPGATAVVMNYLQSETGANVQLDDDAFWNVDHVTLTYYPVGPEDYEGTMVRCRWLQPVQSLAHLIEYRSNARSGMCMHSGPSSHAAMPTPMMEYVLF